MLKIEAEKRKIKDNKANDREEDPDDWIYLLIGSFPPKHEDLEEKDILPPVKIPHAEALDEKFRYFIPAVFTLFNIIYWPVFMAK